MRLLALDCDNLQTAGAEKWVIRAQKYRQKKDKGRQPPIDQPHRAHEDEEERGKATIDHKTIHITSNTLVSSVDEWLQTTGMLARHNIPVLFVALHACGSLTPDILRAFLAASSPAVDRKWRPVGGIIVGCCYNLLAPSGSTMLVLRRRVEAYTLTRLSVIQIYFSSRYCTTSRPTTSSPAIVSSTCGANSINVAPHA